MRATEYSFADASPSTSSESIRSTPMFVRWPILPDKRAPPSIGTGKPARDADAPAEEQLDFLRIANRELPRVLEEELALLGKEQREAIEVHLLLIDLDLREIGVVRRVERQARRDRVLHVETPLVLRLPLR